MQKNLFIVSHLPGKLFSLDALDFVDNNIDNSVYLEEGLEADDYFGWVFRKDGNTWTKVELTEEEREEISTTELAKVLDKHIVDTCTGMIVYDVAWWAIPFNRFQYGFTTFHFEV